MQKRIVLNTLAIGLLSLLASAPLSVQAQTRAVSIDLNSPHVPDDINGLDHKLLIHGTYQFTVSAQSTELTDGASIGFLMYSPDASITNATISIPTYYPAWGDASVWTLGGPLFDISRIGDGVLPDEYLTGGATIFSGGFLQPALTPIFTFDVTFGADEGVFCIDSAFFAPSGNWLFSVPGGAPVAPEWTGGGGDGSVGGLRTNSLCMSIYAVPDDPPVFSNCPSELSGSFYYSVPFSTHANDPEGVSLIEYSGSHDGFGTLTVNSSTGSANYTPTETDVGKIVEVIITATESDGPSSECLTRISITPKFGTTVLLHGLALLSDFGDDFDNQASWVLPMGDAIIDRLGAGRVIRIENGLVRLKNGNPVSPMGSAGEQVICFSWIQESFIPFGGFSEAAADALFAILVEGAQDGLWNLDQLHFVAHSRGTVVASETIQRLGLHESDIELSSGIDVDNSIHLTTLDPHPWDISTDCVGDPLRAKDESVNDGLVGLTGILSGGQTRAILPWSNVGFYDNYRQGNCLPDDVWLNGLPGDNLYGLNLTGANNNLTNILGDGDQHNMIHTWYYGTVDSQCVEMNLDSCIGSNGTVDVSGWYSGVFGARGHVGFARNRNYMYDGPSLFSPWNNIPIAEDDNLYAQSIFNGDFSMNHFGIALLGFGKDPGWSMQNQRGRLEGNVNIESNRLKLENGLARAFHNPSYIPSNATHLAFSYQVCDPDKISSSDYFKVFVDNIQVAELFLDKKYDYDWIQIPITGPGYSGGVTLPGTVRNISMLIENSSSPDIDSRIWIDDVHFVLDDEEISRFEEKGSFFVCSPVELRVTDPDGFVVGKDSSELAGTEYEYYVISDVDTGVIITIPNMKDGLYNVEVVPRAGVDPTDVYSLFGYAYGVLDTFATEVEVQNIPVGGYQMEVLQVITCCEVAGDYGHDGEANIRDLIEGITRIFMSGPAAFCLDEADVDGSNEFNIGDVAYLITYMFKGGPAPVCGTTGL